LSLSLDVTEAAVSLAWLHARDNVVPSLVLVDPDGAPRNE